MSAEPEGFTLGRARLLTLLVAVAGIALANLASERVTVELLDSAQCERAYGWPLNWYWRGVIRLPGTVKIPTYGAGTYSPALLRWPVTRYNTLSLTVNAAMWMMILGAVLAACHWMSRRYRPRLGWRPRKTTGIVVLAIVVPTTLANLCFDVPRGSLTANYGWPLYWYWAFVLYSPSGSVVHGWDYSAGRLAGNLFIWLLALVAVILACEWFLRRWSLRFRFSLRTLLATVAIAALFFWWYAAARNRARDQDALIAWAASNRGYVWVERWGPKWLDLVGADPLRRCVVGATLDNIKHEPQNEELLSEMARLSELRYLNLNLEVLTSDMASSLGAMRRLRTLEIKAKDVESLAALGSLTQLERLSLESSNVARNESPEFLVGLTKLKSLTLEIYDDEGEIDEEEADEEEADEQRTVEAEANEGEPDEAGTPVEGKAVEWLAAVGKLPELERLRLKGWLPSAVLTGLRDLRNLKALTLNTTDFGGLEPRESRACLAAVGKLTQLERLHLGITHKDDLAYLSDLTNLRVLTLWYIGVSYEESEDPEKGRDPLSHLPPLPQLEALRVAQLQTTANEIERLAALPRLKSLDLVGSWKSGGPLPNWACLESLERLAVLRDTITVGFLESLATVKHLKEIRISPYPDTNDLAELSLDRGQKLRYSNGEIDGLRRGLEALRRSHPGLVVVNHEAERATDEFEENEGKRPWPFDNDQTIDRGESFMRQFALPLPGP